MDRAWRIWSGGSSTDTEPTIIKEKQAPQINTILLDERDITRIGALLSKADIQSSAKHQLILPVKYHVVQLLIQQCHEISNLGTEYVLSAIRQRFWVINGRVSVKHIGRGCIICRLRKARPNWTSHEHFTFI